jgi:NADH-quinone oxidoreductase subunit I
MKRAFKEIISGFYSLVIGMRITIGQFFKRTVTVQYPYATLPIPARFRGHIELVRDPETGQPKCYACKLCERACPSDCILVDGAKLEGAKKKSVTVYKLDFTKCSLCGSCVEACRDAAIRYSRDYNLAGFSKEEYIMDLFAKLQAEAQAAGVPPEAPATVRPVKSEPAALPQTQALVPGARQGQTQQELRPTVLAQTQTPLPGARQSQVQQELRPAAPAPRSEPPKMEPVKAAAP